MGSPGALPKNTAASPTEVIPRPRKYQYRILDLEVKHSLAKRREDTANSAEADPRTAILSGVWPTPGTKNGGTSPSRLVSVSMAMKDRTPMYAIEERDFLTRGLFSGNVLLDVRVPLAT